MLVKPLSLWVLPVISLWSLIHSTRQESVPEYEFPEYFRFGVGSSAYQTEGAWNFRPKSKNIWDVFSHIPGKIRNNETGDDACKSYKYYERDREMINYLEADFYRLSISWTRILPDGFVNKISQVGIDHYNSVLGDLNGNSIEPIVTMYNWDLPQVLQDLGGWTNPNVIFWTKDYARVLFRFFGDKVKTWVTFNKPKQIAMGYSTDKYAPGANVHGIGDYLAAKHIVMAHASIWHTYREEFKTKQKGFIGISLDVNFRQGATGSADDMQAASDALDFEVGLYAHPLFSAAGGFPPRVKTLVDEKSVKKGFSASRLPVFTPGEIKFCKGTGDFLGINHFSTRFVTRKNFVPQFIPSMEDDLGVNLSVLKNNLPIYPLGLRGALNWLKVSYQNPSIMIFENGLPTNGSLLDSDRIDYFKKYMANMLDAIREDKVNVVGYGVWSLMDSFEWKSGYKSKYGLFSVDFNDDQRKRTARLSAIWYKNLIETKILDPDFEPEFEDISF